LEEVPHLLVCYNVTLRIIGNHQIENNSLINGDQNLGRCYISDLVTMLIGIHIFLLLIILNQFSNYNSLFFHHLLSLPLAREIIMKAMAVVEVGVTEDLVLEHVVDVVLIEGMVLDPKGVMKAMVIGVALTECTIMKDVVLIEGMVLDPKGVMKVMVIGVAVGLLNEEDIPEGALTEDLVMEG